MPSYGELCSFCSLRAEVDRRLKLRAAAVATTGAEP
jgi:hypothetical protein